MRVNPATRRFPPPAAEHAVSEQGQKPDQELRAEHGRKGDETQHRQDRGAQQQRLRCRNRRPRKGARGNRRGKEGRQQPHAHCPWQYEAGGGASNFEPIVQIHPAGFDTRELVQEPDERSGK